jgi:hypothetical protein
MYLTSQSQDRQYTMYVCTFNFIRVHFGFKGFRYSAHTRPIENPIAMPGKRKAASKAPLRSLSDPRMPKCPPGKGKSQKPQGTCKRQEVKGTAFERKSNGSKVVGKSNIPEHQVRRSAAIETNLKSKPNETVHDVPHDVPCFPDGTKIRFDDLDLEQLGCMHIFVKTHWKPVPITLDIHVNDTIEQIKGKIQARGIPTHGMKLMVELEPGRPRQSCLDTGIPNRGTIYMVEETDLNMVTSQCVSKYQRVASGDCSGLLVSPGVRCESYCVELRTCH